MKDKSFPLNYFEYSYLTHSVQQRSQHIKGGRWGKEGTQMDKKPKQNKRTVKLKETKKCNSFGKKNLKIEAAVSPDNFVNFKSVLRAELKILMLFPLHNI